jgi:hypothetical protein
LANVKGLSLPGELSSRKIVYKAVGPVSKMRMMKKQKAYADAGHKSNNLIPVWITRTFEAIALPDMRTDHMHNCIVYLVKQYQELMENPKSDTYVGIVYAMNTSDYNYDLVTNNPFVKRYIEARKRLIRMWQGEFTKELRFRGECAIEIEDLEIKGDI